jgi:hypothetical protein
LDQRHEDNATSPKKEAEQETFARQEVKGGFQGVGVSGKLASYAIGVLDEQSK